MPLQFHLDDEFLRYQASGEVEFQEGFEVFQQGLSEAAAAKRSVPWPVLFDIRESNEKRRADELKGIAMVLSQHRGIVADHCAVVVSSPLYYGVSRMFAHFAEEYGVSMQIFDNVEAAESWLREPTFEE